ncbi:uncharacterized protein LOC106136505 [Amyelois transitella]|uniref:uncharacterized protein LOC106136505 n=1 Tax=Amyelois transitella TaxID=680683 RepID=UPI00067E5AA5|nr:uncharacterized protein LOC106136505 [Amyelois transitella]
MPAPVSQRVDIKDCRKVFPPHPCDSKPPCDPEKDPEGECLKPYLCFEKIKNPEVNEATRCKSGSFLSVMKCAKIEPPHPCDDPPPKCTEKCKYRKYECNEPQLCVQKIKNPELHGPECMEPVCKENAPKKE